MFKKLAVTCEFELDAVNQVLTEEELAIVQVLPEDVLTSIFQELEETFGLGIAEGGEHPLIIRALRGLGFNDMLIRKFGKWILRQGIEDGWLLDELGYHSNTSIC